MSRCQADIAFERLVDDWCGELAEAESEALEEHVFECASCTTRLETIAQMEEGVRALLGSGAGFGLPLTRGLYEAFLKNGLVLREYHLTPGGSVDCTVAPGEHFGVCWLSADLAKAERVSVAYLDATTRRPLIEIDDAPFDRARGVVGVAASSEVLRSLPKTMIDVLLTVFESGAASESVRYTMVHSPPGASAGD